MVGFSHIYNATTNSRGQIKDTLFVMFSSSMSSFSPKLTSKCVRCFVMIAILLGTLISSQGVFSSHGLAAITPDHSSTFSASKSQSHSHTNQGEASAEQTDIVDAHHPHHTADHTHDKAHALPTCWTSSSDMRPDWCPKVHPKIEMIQASRLERPPMI